MPANALRRPANLTIAQFLAFEDARSEEERWELIEGVAHMMAPPTIRHQLIVSVLER